MRPMGFACLLLWPPWCGNYDGKLETTKLLVLHCNLIDVKRCCINIMRITTVFYPTSAPAHTMEQMEVGRLFLASTCSTTLILMEIKVDIKNRYKIQQKNIKNTDETGKNTETNTTQDLLGDGNAGERSGGSSFPDKSLAPF